MKVFEFNEEFEPRYPDDLKKIRDYLEARGKLNASNKKLDSLYRDYCDEKCDAIWLGPNDDVLEGFAKYLSKIDLY